MKNWMILNIKMSFVSYEKTEYHTHALIVFFFYVQNQKNEENLQTGYMNKGKTKEANDC